MQALVNRNDNERRLGFIFEFVMNLVRNMVYKITLEAQSSSYLEISAFQINNNNKIYYNQFTFETIKEFQYFSLFDNLYNICNELRNIINNNALLNEANDILILSIKNTDINFILKEKELVKFV